MRETCGYSCIFMGYLGVLPELGLMLPVSMTHLFTCDTYLCPCAARLARRIRDALTVKLLDF